TKAWGKAGNLGREGRRTLGDCATPVWVYQAGGVRMSRLLRKLSLPDLHFCPGRSRARNPSDARSKAEGFPPVLSLKVGGGLGGKSSRTVCLLRQRDGASIVVIIPLQDSPFGVPDDLCRDYHLVIILLFSLKRTFCPSLPFQPSQGSDPHPLSPNRA